MKKKAYIEPTLVVMAIKTEHLLGSASDPTVGINDGENDDTVDNPDDILSRRSDPRNCWDEEEEADDYEYGTVKY